MHAPTRTKNRLSYVPWVALIAFLFIFVGVIVWATGANKALSNTNVALATLQVEADGYVDTIHSVATGASVVCCLMAALMVLMSGGRTCMEKAVDQRGKAVCGSWLWLATEAVLCAVWWAILFWLVFVIFGSCLWYGAVYTVQGVLQVSIDTAIAGGNQTSPSPPPPMLPPSPPLDMNATRSPPRPPRSPPAAFICPNTCLNLAIFDFLVQKNICICSVSSLSTALDHTNKAYDALGSVVAGAFLMWCGASFLLMSSVADFAKTKRERELLLRAQRSAVDAAAGQMALGTAPQGGMYPQGYQQDTLPLLKTQQMQQAALQQQQMQQMQMAQMMAQAQAAQMVRPPGGGGSAAGSHANLGNAV